MKIRSLRLVKAAAFMVVVTTLSVLAAPREMSVQVRNGQLRSAPSFLSRVLATVNYGDRLQVVEEQGDWVQGRTPAGETGWLHGSALTRKRIVLSAATTDAEVAASSGELALAGKGFNAQVEAEFKERNSEVDFTWIDRMENIRIPVPDIQAFLRSGGVQGNEGGGQ